MRYTVLLHYHEPTAEELGPEVVARGARAFEAYAKALDGDGELSVQHGPLSDGEEQPGGTFAIGVADLDDPIR